MIILKECERLDLVADEQDFGKGIMVMYQKRFYNTAAGRWTCISDHEQRPLYPHLRDEVKDNMADAESKLAEMKAIFTGKAVEVPTPTPAPTPATGSGDGLGSRLEEIMIKVLAEQSTEKVVEFAKPILEKHIKETFGVLPQKHVVVTPKAEREVEGATHEKFEDVLNLVSLDIPVFLSGAAGTGKNVICKQVAEGLGLEFYFTNAVTQEYQLKGFIDANGTYHETQFYKAFTQGGLFFLDEMDGSIPETLIILNSAIANRYFDFPTGRVDAHPDFRIIAAGNTVGTGADIEYTGRFQLDASSLDRFALICIDYSKNIENAITNNNSDLCKFARAFRKICEDAGIRCLFTYRSMERICKLEGIMELSEVLRIALTKGLGKDDVRIIANNFRFDNKYVEALKNLA